MPMRGTSQLFTENLLSHSTEKLRRGTLLCFTIFLVSKRFMDKRGGVGGGRTGVSRFSVKHFLSQIGEKFRRGTIYCFIKSGYRKKFAYEGNITIFYRKFVVSQDR